MIDFSNIENEKQGGLAIRTRTNHETLLIMRTIVSPSNRTIRKVIGAINASPRNTSARQNKKKEKENIAKYLRGVELGEEAG